MGKDFCFERHIKLIFIISALLSHQMDQLLKLSKELTDGKQEVDGIKENIKSLEKELKKQEIMMKAHAPKLVVSIKLKFKFSSLHVHFIKSLVISRN